MKRIKGRGNICEGEVDYEGDGVNVVNVED